MTSSPVQAQRRLEFYESGFGYADCRWSLLYDGLVPEELQPLRYEAFYTSDLRNVSSATITSWRPGVAGQTPRLHLFRYQNGFLRYDSTTTGRGRLVKQYTYAHADSGTAVFFAISGDDGRPAYNRTVRCLFPAGWQTTASRTLAGDEGAEQVVTFAYDSLGRAVQVASRGQTRTVAYRSVDPDNLAMLAPLLAARIRTGEVFTITNITATESRFEKFLIVGDRLLAELLRERAERTRYRVQLFRFDRKGRCRDFFSAASPLALGDADVSGKAPDVLSARRRGRRWMLKSRIDGVETTQEVKPTTL